MSRKAKPDPKRKITCVTCRRPHQPYGGYALMGDALDALESVGPLCFDCMRYVMERMQQRNPVTQHSELLVHEQPEIVAAMLRKQVQQ